MIETNSKKDNMEVNLKGEPELKKIQLQAIAKEYFHFIPSLEINYEALLRENSNFLSYNLPSSLNEVFIRLDEAPVFWVYKSALNKYLDEFVKLYFHNGEINYLRVKEFFQKWINVGSDNDKKYFATSAISNLENTLNKKNFINLILHANILTFDKSLYNPYKAVELLEKAKEIVTTINIKSDYQDELKYLIEVYKGFTYLKLNDHQLSNAIFSEAINSKPYGITAKFYLAFTESLLNNFDSAKFLLKEILNYDISRIEYSIASNNYHIFKYFLRNPIFKNVFYIEEFSLYTDYIEEILLEQRKTDLNSLTILNNNFTELHNSKLDTYFNENVLRNISFLEKFLTQTNRSTHIFYLISLERIKKKFNDTIHLITESIKEKHYSHIKENLKEYEFQIEINTEHINRLGNVCQEEVKNLKEKLNLSLQQLEQMAVEKINYLEQRINHLNSDKKYSGQSSFSNTMTYNSVLSILVFLIAGYSESFQSNEWEISSVISIIFFGGIKWGIISFLIGFLIAIFVAGYVIVERANTKQRIIKNIEDIKANRESENQYLRKEVERREKSINESYNKEINHFKQLNGEIKIQKESKEAELKAKADEKINELLKNMPVDV